MTNIANPVYDVVFKYLMDDPRIARMLVDERLYSDDQDMSLIIHRLTMAAADAQVRHSMNVEDEYFSAIERRDTELMLKDKQLAEKTVLLAEKDGQLAEKDGQLRELLRSSVLTLHKAGLSPETIAASLGKDVDVIKTLLKE
jgi:hypothetical protein